MKPAAMLTVLLLAAAGPEPPVAAPAVAIETHVVLAIQALVVEDGRSKPVATAPETEVGPSTPGRVELTVPWGDPPSTLTLRLTARIASLTQDGETALAFEATATPLGRASVTASRELRLTEEGAGLFEAYGDQDRRLLLTIRAERVARAVVRPPIVVGAPVRFKVAVERVDGDRVVLLETNDLNTFVGQSVEYSFRRGQDQDLESLRLELLPASVAGDVVTIDADVDGALPGAAGSVLISRRERIVASRRATSSILAVTGNPPAGYRFQVTPDF